MRRKGFTLLELMVVLGILSVLLLLLVGAIQRVKDKVKVVLSGIHTTINDDLMTLVDNEIKNNGL
jgi:prepilin-type N-terminal cleavage/methylation domain-containing protein